MLTRREFGARLGAVPLLGLAQAGRAVAGGRAGHHVVEIRRFAFAPPDLRIARGDRVTWINRDAAPHTATEQASARWDTGALGRGAEASLTFERAGRFAYFCAFHPHMRGSIEVVEG